jgi:hypothetical protein
MIAVGMMIGIDQVPRLNFGVVGYFTVIIKRERKPDPPGNICRLIAINSQYRLANILKKSLNLIGTLCKFRVELNDGFCLLYFLLLRERHLTRFWCWINSLQNTFLIELHEKFSTKEVENRIIREQRLDSVRA